MNITQITHILKQVLHVCLVQQFNHILLCLQLSHMSNVSYIKQCDFVTVKQGNCFLLMCFTSHISLSPIWKWWGVLNVCHTLGLSFKVLLRLTVILYTT